MGLRSTLQAGKQYAGIVIPSGKDPYRLFAKWFKDALATSKTEPNAMVLATVTKNGRPRTRFVLLKSFDGKGFYFFTNAKSAKGAELKQNPFAALLFYWPEMHRQIRIEGKVKKLSVPAVQAYFRTRPKESQIASLVSKQSAQLLSREVLLKEYLSAEKYFSKSAVPLPKDWAGYMLTPDYFEFWSGMPNRLHDRLEFKKQKNGWKIGRLYP